MEIPDAEHIKEVKQANRIAYLVAGFIRQTLTIEEKEELDDWITASDENMRLFGELTDEKNIAVSLRAYDNINVEDALRKVKFNITQRRRPRRFWQYAIAASIIVLAGLTVLLIRDNRVKKEPEIIVKTQDINPGSGQARLTLEDGSVIMLGNKDTVINSTINVSAAMNQISYLGLEQSPEQYHTLTIPRKGHYRMVLPDGTKVWLNAESSIRYPLAFSKTQRMVYVTGETYFDVAKDPDKPFRVVASDMLVQAVGTQFNVNSYADEPLKVTTLVEGKVKIFVPGDSLLLSTGEQSLVTDGKITKTNAEITTATAWKENTFRFRNTGLSVIMRQLARWYDAEIEFKEPVDVLLNATIDRTVPVSKVLELLQATGHVKFKIENNKITVSR